MHNVILIAALVLRYFSESESERERESSKLLKTLSGTFILREHRICFYKIMWQRRFPAKNNV